MKVGFLVVCTSMAVGLLTVPAAGEEVHYEFLYDFGLFCG